jgi:hypothetical protein
VPPVVVVTGGRDGLRILLNSMPHRRDAVCAFGNTRERLEAGGWRLEAGGWRLEAGGWRLEAGG